MVAEQSIPVVDLFAGPGGLGEGFSAGLPDGRRPFELIISVESDPAAHRTLRLRAFRHLYERAGEALPAAYRDLAAGKPVPRFDRLSKVRWAEAGKRALKLTLGDRRDDACLDSKLRAAGIGPDVPWVLIGGPPCQAYSLVGRARNRGNAKYRSSEDKRHRLYEEYLRVIRAFSPTVFVMENVKGLLSSTYAGQRIFEKILADLARPRGRYGAQYNIHALSSDALYEPGMIPEDLDAHSFVVEAERHGVPQRRHRVFLIGIRQDVDFTTNVILPHEEARTVFDVLGEMPRLRSKLTKEPDSDLQWEQAMADNVAFLRSNSRELPQSVRKYVRNYRATGLDFPLRKEGRRRLETLSGWTGATLANGDKLRRWIRRKPPNSLQNHEPRGHMRSDLARYLFCALYAATEKRSPTAGDFPDSLAPKHANWTSGKFADRFRVQVAEQPSSTITSHIAKDGHYYIHPDISQCRSLSVREAARLQTFPDNYVFLGNRTEQYIQVGNAVPPYLANKIAKVIANMFTSISDREKRLGRDTGTECLTAE